MCKGQECKERQTDLSPQLLDLTARMTSEHSSRLTAVVLTAGVFLCARTMHALLHTQDATHLKPTHISICA